MTRNELFAAFKENLPRFPLLACLPSEELAARLKASRQTEIEVAFGFFPGAGPRELDQARRQLASHFCSLFPVYSDKALIASLQACGLDPCRIKSPSGDGLPEHCAKNKRALLLAFCLQTLPQSYRTAKTGQSLAQVCIQQHFLPGIDALEAAGFDIRAPFESPARYGGKSDITYPIFAAIECGANEITERLANPECAALRDRQGRSPLLAAIDNGRTSPAAVQALLAFCSPNETDPRGTSAFLLALRDIHAKPNVCLIKRKSLNRSPFRYTFEAIMSHPRFERGQLALAKPQILETLRANRKIDASSVFGQIESFLERGELEKALETLHNSVDRSLLLEIAQEEMLESAQSKPRSRRI